MEGRNRVRAGDLAGTVVSTRNQKRVRNKRSTRQARVRYLVLASAEVSGHEFTPAVKMDAHRLRLQRLRRDAAPKGQFLLRRYGTAEAGP